MGSELIAVTSLEAGDTGIIHVIEGGNALTSRLAGMVIVQGADTRVVLGSGEAGDGLYPRCFLCFPSLMSSEA